MKVFLFLVLTVTGSLASPVNSFARETGKFSLNLYKTVRGSGEDNVVISPVSVQTALGLAYMGADGETAAEMSSVMHLERDRSAVSDSYKALLDHHAGSGSVKIANKMFLDKKYSPRPEFTTLVTEKFYSSAETLDTSDAPESARTINSWVETKTNNKIHDLVTASDVENTSSVLVNAVYFNADWENEFRKSTTYDQDFWTSAKTSKKVEMMHQTSYFQFGHFDAMKIVNLRYKNSDLSLLVILPHEKEGLSSVEETIEQMDVKDVMSSLKKEEVRLSLPKFKTESKVELKQTLTQMGMGHMFTDDANFSKLSAERVKVSDVIHKAVLEVDEKGTEAAAATAVFMAVALSAPYPPPPPPKEFTADHPFVYLLVDSNGHIFFMGRYVK